MHMFTGATLIVVAFIVWWFASWKNHPERTAAGFVLEFFVASFLSLCLALAAGSIVHSMLPTKVLLVGCRQLVAARGGSSEQFIWKDVYSQEPAADEVYLVLARNADGDLFLHKSLIDHSNIVEDPHLKHEASWCESQIVTDTSSPLASWALGQGETEQDTFIVPVGSVPEEHF